MRDASPLELASSLGILSAAAATVAAANRAGILRRGRLLAGVATITVIDLRRRGRIRIVVVRLDGERWHANGCGEHERDGGEKLEHFCIRIFLCFEPCLTRLTNHTVEPGVN